MGRYGGLATRICRGGFAHVPGFTNSSFLAIFPLRAEGICFPVRPAVLRCENSADASALVRGNCESDLGRELDEVFGHLRRSVAHLYGLMKFGPNIIMRTHRLGFAQ